MWIGRSLLGLEHLHVADVVYVQLRLQHYYETLSVQAHRQNGSTKRHFAYCRVSLDAVNDCLHSVGHERTLVFCIRSTRGDNVNATKEVEKSISRLETSPSCDSDCLLKGSVVYMR